MGIVWDLLKCPPFVETVTAKELHWNSCLCVRRRMLEQTSVHEVLKYFGERYNVPLEVCRIIHVRAALQGHLKVPDLNVDKRLWDFSEKLISNVNRGLRRAGLLRSEGQS